MKYTCKNYNYKNYIRILSVSVKLADATLVSQSRRQLVMQWMSEVRLASILSK